MSRVKGTSKHGRAAELMRKLKYEHDFDAAEEMVKIFRTGKLRPMEKFKVAAEIASYQYPKLKAMELKADAGEMITFNIDLTGVATKGETTDAA